ncbi:unnamed protein product [Prorocentrum cordatum]|uniref:Uncharacterized protein n=1 Tax=Prorocentrum cordatum TaxID=2364126 RepID=A0ABN9RYP6_9DINO|nr:unnamed protein product [Polarella glacialis]
MVRQEYVDNFEKDTVRGDSTKWVDVEADESVLATAITENKETKQWEQWAGVVERGEPNAFALFKTESDRTDRKVMLHSDGARSYKMRATGLLRDAAIHCEKRVKRGGKRERMKDVF